jgi:hypothetical protein
MEQNFLRRIYIMKIEYDGHIYETREHIERDYDYYSKKWHRAHGPKITVLSRDVYIDNKLVKNYNCWPHGGEHTALIKELPLEALPLHLNCGNYHAVKIIKKRLKEGK